MRIICLVKFVPNPENFVYDYEKNILVRENVRMILNPDDASALAFALKQKEKNPNAFVEIVCMAPLSVLEHVRDLIRRGADRATLISDKAYVGSDTYVTSKILARYLKTVAYDLILTGTHSLDGDTAHVPSQIAEILKLPQMSHVKKIEEFDLTQKEAVCEVEYDNVIERYALPLPAVFAISKESGYKLPFVRYADLEKDVEAQIHVLHNEALSFSSNEIGFEGSLTKVARAFAKKMEKKERIVVANDEEGIEKVYQFLKGKGFI